MLKRRWACAALLCAAILIGSAAQSAKATERDLVTPSGWEFSSTLYLWAFWLNMGQTVDDQSISVDVSIIDVLKAADSFAGWFSYQEARKGRFSLYSDIQYMKIDLSGDMARTRNVGSGLSLNASVDGAVHFELAIIEAGMTYELGRRYAQASGGSLKDGGSDFTPYSTFDLIAGVRYWYLDVGLNLAIDASATTPIGWTRSGGIATSPSVEVNWLDPLIGLRIRHNLAPRKRLFFRGDIGGFGVGSDFTWQVVAGYNWSRDRKFLGMDVSGVIGYRALGVDYSEGGGSKFAYDNVLHGPLLGLRFAF